jgi:hypothetical protein
LSDLNLWQWVLIEAGVVAIALVAARVEFWQRWMGALERRLAGWAERPGRCFAGIVGAAVLWRLARLVVEPVPMPLYHDEFSYLLGADTFFHGRLTNPQPAVPVAFETIHTNLWPTYQSMYLPGPALALTVGKVLGSPWIAVLGVTALLCGAVYWMVSGWLPRRYGVAAGLLALAITGNMHWWFDNYFCIALSSLGCALVVGSVPRIACRRRWQTGCVMGLGLAILMLVRPYEGFCVAFPCVAVMVWSMRGAGWRKIGALAAGPLAMLAGTAGWLLFYNWRGTGHPLLFPYMLNFRDYHITGPFLFSSKRVWTMARWGTGCWWRGVRFGSEYGLH